MTAPLETARLRRFLLQGILDGLPDLVARAVEAFGLTRQGVNKQLRALAAEGRVVARGTTRSRSYELVTRRQRWAFELSAGLEEHLIWSQEVAPFLGALPRNVREICQHGFTEMLNNAIDHSEGSQVVAAASVSPVHVELAVEDDGVGIFHKIVDRFGFPSERDAILQLSKGKLTTDPSRHSGEGIFFTSRMFDRFHLRSHELLFRHDEGDRPDLLVEEQGYVRGTLVTMAIAADSTRTAREVFDRFTTDYEFDVTLVPVALARYGDDGLVSRSQAKRLLARFENFRQALLDFQGVESIGQAFADEVFRVFPAQNPHTLLIPLHASPEVERMIRRAQSARGST